MIITIYGTDKCWACQEAIQLIHENEYMYRYKNTNIEANYSELKSRLPAATTIPQIWLDDRYIGGLEQLKQFLG